MAASKLHPARHLLYAFALGATLTTIGFTVAYFDHFGGRRSARTVVIVGSETLRPLMEACLRDWKHAGGGLSIEVRGGGSGKGIAALSQKQADLAMVSRALLIDERQSLEADAPVEMVPLAREALALVVHPSVGLDALDVPTAGHVLAGGVQQWSALGASGGLVQVVARRPSSGSAALVAQRLLDGRSAAAVRITETHEQVLNTVASLPGAIGYADAGLAQARAGQVKVLALRSEAGEPAFAPSPAALADGNYPLGRTLYAVGHATMSADLRAFVKACQGQAGRLHREGLGFLPP